MPFLSAIICAMFSICKVSILYFFGIGIFCFLFPDTICKYGPNSPFFKFITLSFNLNVFREYGSPDSINFFAYSKSISSGSSASLIE